MKRIIFWILGFPVAVVLIAFALANRSPVTISLDPVSPADPWFSISLPVWVVLFAGIFLGLVIGWIAAWFSQGKWRKAARKADSELINERSARQSIEKKLKSMAIVPHQADGTNA